MADLKEMKGLIEEDHAGHLIYNRRVAEPSGVGACAPHTAHRTRSVVSDHHIA